MYTYRSLSLYIYIYMYIYLSIYLYLSLSIYINIYIYMHNKTCNSPSRVDTLPSQVPPKDGGKERALFVMGESGQSVSPQQSPGGKRKGQ